MDAVFMQIDREKAQNFALTAIYKGITSPSTRKNIPRGCQIPRKKGNSKKKPILAII